MTIDCHSSGGAKSHKKLETSSLIVVISFVHKTPKRSQGISRTICVRAADNIPSIELPNFPAKPPTFTPIDHAVSPRLRADMFRRHHPNTSISFYEIALIEIFDCSN
ncbi:unnamed protein product [Caenorhabditis brenneri]